MCLKYEPSSEPLHICSGPKLQPEVEGLTRQESLQYVTVSPPTHFFFFFFITLKPRVE